jgi:hypothetical protein
MKVRNTVWLAWATAVLTLCGSRAASAEIVMLTSGATMSIKGHRVSGDTIVLTLRSGGEVTCDRSLVEKIIPDEVPHPDPAPPVAPLQKPADTGDRSLLQSRPYGELIEATARANGVDPLLVRALIQVESNYQPRARSSKGAMGLMQLMPAVAREYNVQNAYDPAANVTAGVQKLKTLIDKWGTELGLAAYDAGEAAVARYGGVPPYRETQSYVTRILALLGQPRAR